MAITRAQYDQIYKETDLAGLYDFFNDPPPAGISKGRFESLYLASKFWRLNNIYTIVNKAGELCKFRMNLAQHKVYAASKIHPRIIILKSRQQGISTFWLVSYFDDSIFGKYLSIGLMAQGTDEAATLLERTKLLWDQLSDDIKTKINVAVTADNAKKFALTNECNIFIRVSFRSTTLQRLHVSEFGKIANNYPQRAKEVKTGTLQALAQGNTGVIESTAEGNNAFKVMWNDATLAFHSGQMTPKDFYPVFLSWLDDPDCLMAVDQTVDEDARKYFEDLERGTGVVLTKQQKNFWISQRRELGGDIFQEYPATPEEAFMASRDGTYWARKFNEEVVRKGRVLSGLHDANLPIHVYFDLGVDDYFVMGFVQWYRGEWRVIDEYKNEGMGIAHYLDIAHERYGNDIAYYNFPHDIAVRELGTQDDSGRAKSREKIVRDYLKEIASSARIRKFKKTSDLENDIETVRHMIPKMAIDPKCEYLISCFNNYSKVWDEKTQQFISKAVHDEFSHGADVIRAIATYTIESDRINESRHEQPRRRKPTGTAI